MAEAAGLKINDGIAVNVQCRTSDPAIYAAVERDSGLAPDALLFVDDKSENVEAARARGWHAHLFETAAGWADCLVDAGLLTRGEAA